MLIDCHGINTCIAALYRKDGKEIGEDAHVRARWCVTGQLNIKYKAVTPLRDNCPVTLIAKTRSIEGKKVWVDVQVLDEKGNVTVTSEILGIEVTDGKVPGR